MGIIRGAFVFVIGVLLFLSLFFMNASLNLTWSLEYNTLEPNIVNYAGGVMNDTGIRDKIEKEFPTIELYCMAHNNYVFMEQGFESEIPCEVADLGVDRFLEKAVSNFVYEIYYKDYNCDFWTCVKEANEPFVLVSEKAKDYWKFIFKNLLLISLGLFVLLFFAFRLKYNAFIVSGVLMIISSFLVKKLNTVFSILPSFSFFDILEIFFVKTGRVFLIMCIIGGLLIVTGILLRVFKIGFKISTLFKTKDKKGNKTLSKEDIKEAVREGLGGSKDKEESTSKKKKSKKK